MSKSWISLSPTEKFPFASVCIQVNQVYMRERWIGRRHVGVEHLVSESFPWKWVSSSLPKYSVLIFHHNKYFFHCGIFNYLSYQKRNYIFVT